MAPGEESALSEAATRRRSSSRGGGVIQTEAAEAAILSAVEHARAEGAPYAGAPLNLVNVLRPRPSRARPLFAAAGLEDAEEAWTAAAWLHSIKVNELVARALLRPCCLSSLASRNPRMELAFIRGLGHAGCLQVTKWEDPKLAASCGQCGA